MKFLYIIHGETLMDSRASVFVWQQNRRHGSIRFGDDPEFGASEENVVGKVNRWLL